MSNEFQSIDAQDETSEITKVTWRELQDDFNAELVREMNLEPGEMMILLW